MPEVFTILEAVSLPSMLFWPLENIRFRTPVQRRQHLLFLHAQHDRKRWAGSSGSRPLPRA